METPADDGSTHPFLRALGEPARRRVVEGATEARFGPGRLLLREGGEADTLYLLLSGRVALEVHAPGRAPAILETLDAGDVLGLSWLTPPYRWTLDARSVQPTVALAIDAARLRARMEADHDLGFAIARDLLGRLYERLRRVRLQRLDLYRAEPAPGGGR